MEIKSPRWFFIYWWDTILTSLLWRHNGRGNVSNHQLHDCLLNRLFRLRSKNTSKLRVTGLCAGNSPETGEFPAQMASNAENVSIWWRHHDITNRQVPHEMSMGWILLKLNYGRTWLCNILNHDRYSQKYISNCPNRKLEVRISMVIF